MQVIAKRSLMFINPKNASVKAKTSAGPGVQSLPDWVRQSAGFNLAIGDGTLLEIVAVPPKPAPQAKSVDPSGGKEKEGDGGGSKGGDKK